jgi:hypothetical protein
MEKWKAKNASHFPTPPTTATGHIYHPLRYTNNLAGTKDRAGQPAGSIFIQPAATINRHRQPGGGFFVQQNADFSVGIDK